MSRNNSFGTQREQAVENKLRELHYLTASRRHLEGPGDILAVPLAVHHQRGLLVEVKGTLEYPWRSKWGPEQRGALLLAADIYDVEPMLAWWPPNLRDGPMWLPESEWPMTIATIQKVNQ